MKYAYVHPATAYAFESRPGWYRIANLSSSGSCRFLILTGDHSHTVSLGGSGTPIDITPKSMAVNMFVYLGAA